MGGVAVMKAAESRRPSKLFAKPFQKQRVFLQAFPKKALVVLWDFNELQGLQTQMVRLQIFSSRRPPFSLAPDAVAPHFAASRRGASRTLSRSRRLRRDGWGTRSWRSSDLDREDFEPSRYSGFWKEISLISPCLAFFAIPKSTAADPRLARRTKLITQLEQQRELAKDEGYVVKRQKWVKGEDGSSSWSMRRSGSNDGGGWMGQAIAI
jgi:hypothetical protein